MNNLRLSILAVLCFVSFQLSAQGVDLGGTIDNTTTFRTAGKDWATGDWGNLNQSDKISLFFSLSGGTLNLSGKGSFKAEYDVDNKTNTYVAPNLTDLNLDNLFLEAFFATPGNDAFSSFALQAGRLKTSDPTRLILNQTLDGISFRSVGPSFNFNLFGGYSGFLYKKASQLNLTTADSAALTDDTAYFAAPRLVVQTNLQFNNLGGSSLTLGYVYQQDFNDKINPGRVAAVGQAYDANKSGLLNTHHVVLALNSKLERGIYLDLDVAGLSTTSLLPDTNTSLNKAVPVLGLAGNFVLSFFSEDGSNSIKIKSFAASGDNNLRTNFTEGSSTTLTSSNLYKSLNSPTFGMVFSPELGNLVTGSLELNYKFFTDAKSGSSLGLIAEAIGFFRPVLGPLSVVGMDTASKDYYLGSELDATLTWRPAADLGLSLATGLFVPNSAVGGPFNGYIHVVDTKTVLYCSLSF